MKNKDQILTAVREQFKLDWDGDHGIRHWDRVNWRGMKLAKDEGADLQVVQLFAYLHDACRISETHDPDHGRRGAAFAQQLFDDGLLDITHHQMELLHFAIKYHNSSGSNCSSPTVCCCWDADRLDLGRVGITPDPKRMKTETGRYMARLQEKEDGDVQSAA